MKGMLNVLNINKCLMGQNNLYFWMEIIDKKGGGRFCQWVKKGKRLPWFHQIS
jgi:hypothetical protein